MDEASDTVTVRLFAGLQSGTRDRLTRYAAFGWG
jgi:hypothetical protein